jgi:putative ABC transport system permease protein
VQIIPMLEDYVGGVRRGLWVLLGAVGLVLLIACVNVANLLLARAATRQREMAVRIALGAGRWRLLRQLLTESALLASAGAALGFPLAAWGVKLILTVSPDSIPRAGEINLDSRVLAFTAAVSLLTGIIFGLAPAIQSGKVNMQETLKVTARATTGGRRRLRHGLVVTEIALTLVLLVGAGLLLRSFYRLQQASLGLVTERVLSFRVNLPQQKYAGERQQIGFVNQVTEKLRAQPGVGAVGVASRVPLSPSGMWQTQFLPDGQSLPESGQAPSMEVTVVSPDYFHALAIPLLRGRFFTEQDTRSDIREETLQGLTTAQRMMAGLKVMIVDEEFARRHWPNADAVGKRVLFGLSPRAPVATVVGVVGRVKLNGLTADNDLPQGYFPFLQTPVNAMTFAVKTTLEPERLIAAARRQVSAVDSEQPISEIGSFAEMRSESVAPQRLNLLLLGLFAAVALLLAVVGVYGVMSYTVTQRTPEIGVRLALGAQGRDVLRLVVRQGLALLFIGIVIGLAAAFILTRVMATLLFEVSPTDPVIFMSVPLLLIVVALLACWIPARRAAKVDPMAALRHD